jgi:RNA polymerase sigma factor (sigma-70 family)
VDALLDRPGSTNRPGRGRAPPARRRPPLKSLTGLVAGQPSVKQGRFRASLLGKRVDYSGRSVIVNGPGLRLHQCGLPRQIARVLYRPFLIGALLDKGLAPTFRTARDMIDRRDPCVGPVLEEVVRGRPVLLNRAPTLHRMSVQAFEPVLIDDKAIRLHPLACKGFNADFDGDTMAVHLPLSDAARREALDMVLSTRHLFSPADGKLIFAPSLDVVLGCFYMTTTLPPREAADTAPPPGAADARRRAGADELPAVDTARGEGMVFASPGEVILAHAAGKVGTHARIRVRLPASQSVVTGADTAPRAVGGAGTGATVPTTVGRVLFNDLLPAGMSYYDLPMTGKELGHVLLDCHRLLGPEATAGLLDRIKEFGFRAATHGGLSFATDDLATGRPMVERVQQKEDRLRAHYERGKLSAQEFADKLFDLWRSAQDEVTRSVIQAMANDQRGGRHYLNPIYLMLESGARGNADQLRQLAAMRGYMATPSGRPPPHPVTASLRNGLHPFEYLACARGGRWTLATMKASTPDWGYLTRRLVYAAQDVFVTVDDCGTARGRLLRALSDEDGRVLLPLREQLPNRIACETIQSDSGAAVVRPGEVISLQQAALLERLRPDGVRVRSPMTCQAAVGVCRMCYGLDLSTGELAAAHLPVGIIAAQSLGERGSQLTLHTKRSGGAAQGSIAGAWSLLEQVLDPPPAHHPPGTDVLALGDRIVCTVQDLFRSQGAEVDGRHVEVMVAQMLRKVRVVRACDSGLVPGELIDRAAFEAVNERLRADVRVDDPGDSAFARGQVLSRAAAEQEADRLKSEQRRPLACVPAAAAAAVPCVLGISDVALASNSFLAAAAFQHAREVLGRSALAAEVDDLIGPLERIIVGRPQPPAVDLTAPRLSRRAGGRSAAPPPARPPSPPKASDRPPAPAGEEGRKARSNAPPTGVRAAVLRRMSDEELMEHYYRRGPTSPRAFAEIQSRYQAPLAAQASWMLGGDEDQAVRLALRTLSKVADTIGKEDTRWKQGRAFRPWLYTVFHNVLRDHRRARGVVPTGKDLPGPEDDDKVIPFGDHVPTRRPGPEEDHETRERDRALRDCIGRLPERQRAVVTMHMNGLSGVEIAQVLRVRPSTVSKDWKSAQQALKKCLKTKDIQPPPTRGPSVPAGRQGEESHD